MLQCRLVLTTLVRTLAMLHCAALPILLCTAGFDASFMDPLAHMMLSSDSFRAMATSITTLAARHCKGRAVFLHEGGYSDVYVPFCGLAVIEASNSLELSACALIAMMRMSCTVV
jgi:acetoin utilization deacetylase AcuC-like enzyme